MGVDKLLIATEPWKSLIIHWRYAYICSSLRETWWGEGVFLEWGISFGKLYTPKWNGHGWQVRDRPVVPGCELSSPVFSSGSTCASYIGQATFQSAVIGWWVWQWLVQTCEHTTQVTSTAGRQVVTTWTAWLTTAFGRHRRQKIRLSRIGWLTADSCFYPSNYSKKNPLCRLWP